MSDKKYFCSVSGEEIPVARVEFLRESGIPEENWTTVKNSQVRRKKGVYFGEVYGSSGIEEVGELKIVDKVYDESVRAILADQETEDQE